MQTSAHLCNGSVRPSGVVVVVVAGLARQQRRRRRRRARARFLQLARTLVAPMICCERASCHMRAGERSPLVGGGHASFGRHCRRRRRRRSAASSARNNICIRALRVCFPHEQEHTHTHRARAGEPKNERVRSVALNKCHRLVGWLACARLRRSSAVRPNRCATKQAAKAAARRQPKGLVYRVQRDAI